MPNSIMSFASQCSSGFCHALEIFLRKVCPVSLSDHSYTSTTPQLNEGAVTKRSKWGAVMRIGLIGASLCLCLVGLANAGPAKAAIRKDLNVPAEELGSALQVLAKDYDFQVLYRTEIVKDLRTQGAVGSLTSDEALGKVLKGTGLTYKYLDSNTVTIMPAPGGAAAGAADQAPSDLSNGGGKKSSQDFRVAQVDQGKGSQSAAVGNQTGNAQQTSKNPSVGLEEIVVTAQKREERLIDVPISIAVMTGDELQKRNISSIDDLSFSVPGLSIASSGENRRITLRGVSNAFPNGSTSLIGMYLDEADVTSGTAAQLDLRTYDLERIEVLRGPQGTLYGEGSAGGTIRFITKNPVLDRFSMNADVSALFTQDGSPGQRIETMLNTPLIDGVLGLRIAGTFEHDGGWIDQPSADRKDINGQNLAEVRVKGLWQPSSEFTASAMALIHRNDESVSSGEDADGNYTQIAGITTTPRVVDDFDVYNLTLSYEFAFAKLLSATSYTKQNRDTTDYSYTLPDFGPPPAQPLGVYLGLSAVDAKTLTEELRLTSTGLGAWQWTIGSLYRHFRFNDDGNFNLEFPGPSPATLSPTLPAQQDSLSKSWSAFGDTSYQLTERLRVGAGVRYFQDDEQYVTSPTDEQSGRFHSIDPRAYLELKMSDDINLYGSAAKGFRSGGFNALDQPSFGPESVWTYEIGTKTALRASHLSVNAALFFSRYQDYQISGNLLPPNPPLNIYSNAGNAHIKGVEAEGSWQPDSLWSLSLSGDYISSEFVQISATSTAYQVGDPLDLFPRYTVTGSLQREFNWNDRAGFLRLDYSRQGRETFRNRSIGPWYYSESDIINMLNLNSELRMNGNLSLGLFAQNLLNDRGYTDPFSIERGAARSRPRTLGIRFGVTF